MIRPASHKISAPLRRGARSRVSVSGRGFTLVEMMVVVAIIAILAALAIWSATANQNQADMDEFSGHILNVVKEARGRAAANGTRYAVQLTPTGVRWCEDQCPSPNQDDHPNGGEIGRFRRAVGDSRIVSYAESGDIGVGNRPPLTNMPASIQVYFYADGTADSDRTTAQPEGFTAYLQHGTDSNLQYRVAVLPFSGDVKRYISWD
jgi:prepilin-type N-terminal cleavage/methylation domain-containing protein